MFCKYSYCADESDVSGFDCRKNKTIKLTELDQLHPYCMNNFKLSLWRVIYWWALNE
jgi:hypothetical protein